MCGIVGAWLENAYSQDEIRHRLSQALKALSHRGPDGENIWIQEAARVYLAHRRLAIIDLSDGGMQPRYESELSASVTFNGEIYNYIELREELEQAGYAFTSSSDTEVILPLYRQHGDKCFNKLRGMFALAIWDDRHNELILARDPAGKKPLYYSRVNNNFFFASEINALRHLLTDASETLDMLALESYLSFGAVVGELTIYQGIKELPPGSIARLTKAGIFTVKHYFSIEDIKQQKISFDQAVEKSDSILTEAVKLRMRADVPVGVFLSGGIDSGLITALASKNLGIGKLKTYSIGFNDADFDERDLARFVAEQYGTDHSELLIEADVKNEICKIIASYGEPMADPSAVPSYFVSEAAAKHVKVVLNGDGGDELFCGYRRHIAANLIGQMQRFFSEAGSKGLANLVLAMLPQTESSRSKLAFIRRLLEAQALNQIESYQKLSANCFTLHEKQQMQAEAIFINSDLTLLQGHLSRVEQLDYFSKFLALEFIAFLPEALLVKMDIASMQHSIEARSPFLDRELIQFAFSLPDNIKCSLGKMKTKPILRELAKKYLPKEIINQPKQGFEIPLANWLQNDLKQMLTDVLLSPNGIVRQLFKEKELVGLLGNKQTKNLDQNRWAYLVWTLFVLAIWEIEQKKIKQ